MTHSHGAAGRYIISVPQKPQPDRKEKDMTRSKLSRFLLPSIVALVFALPLAASDSPNLGENDSRVTAAACAKCGDGQCQTSCGESARTCPKDCGGGTPSAAPAELVEPAPVPAAGCAKCGDGQCQTSCGENASTCPKDCGGGTPSAAPAELVEPAPVPAAGCAKCGDGQCQTSCGENATTCPKDCGGTPEK
jgi:hypothetical protein